MKSIAQKYLDEGEAKGIEKGEYTKVVEIAKNLLRVGVNIELIAKSTGLTVKEIELTKSR